MAKRHSRRNYSFCGAELDTGFYKKSNKSEKLPPPMQYEPTSQLSPTIDSANLKEKRNDR